MVLGIMVQLCRGRRRGRCRGRIAVPRVCLAELCGLPGRRRDRRTEAGSREARSCGGVIGRAVPVGRVRTEVRGRTKFRSALQPLGHWRQHDSHVLFWPGAFCAWAAAATSGQHALPRGAPVVPLGAGAARAEEPQQPAEARHHGRDAHEPLDGRDRRQPAAPPRHLTR
eukprot:scaffold70472_cov60-Phaeocystis_antarctica.AAC.5